MAEKIKNFLLNHDKLDEIFLAAILHGTLSLRTIPTELMVDFVRAFCHYPVSINELHMISNDFHYIKIAVDKETYILFLKQCLGACANDLYYIDYIDDTTDELNQTVMREVIDYIKQTYTYDLVEFWKYLEEEYGYEIPEELEKIINSPEYLLWENK